MNFKIPTSYESKYIKTSFVDEERFEEYFSEIADLDMVNNKEIINEKISQGIKLFVTNYQSLPEIIDYLNQKYNSSSKEYTWSFDAIREIDKKKIDGCHYEYLDEKYYFGRSFFDKKLPINVIEIIKNFKNAIPEINFFITNSKLARFSDYFLVITSPGCKIFSVAYWTKETFEEVTLQ